jgi:hypothetical protein
MADHFSDIVDLRPPHRPKRTPLVGVLFWVKMMGETYVQAAEIPSNGTRNFSQ